MSDKEREILKKFEEVLPKMTELQKERLLAFGEGMVFKTELQEKEKCAG